ncbi:GNAT family protein [Bifidobacterium subtile]|jgi:RimJ/RimL family protein N-acetyltransferase|uniref:GNAT family N-acetyltransferase n=1 Tax=Bifidobacterium subtile TaxID=77635 RepID=UPI002F356684
MPVNEYGQQIGQTLPDWTPRHRPTRETLEGRYCRLEPLAADRHAAGLFAAYQPAGGALWTYLGIGPFADEAEYARYVRSVERSTDPLFFAVIDRADGAPVGTLSLQRQDPESGVIEIGWVAFSPRMQHTRLSTEAHALLLALVFDRLGYRRCEWKCDSLNGPSRHAAERLGFVYEGTFRSAHVYKQRSRDTDWLAITDADWPECRSALEVWLSPGNFDAAGHQRSTLAEYRGWSRRQE